MFDTPNNEPAMASINLAPPEPTLDAKQLDGLCALWLAHGVSTRSDTATGYAYKVQWFRDWWAREGPRRGWELRQRDMDEFAAYLTTVTSRTGKPLSYHSRNDVLRRLRQMFKWALARGYTEGRDYSAWIPAAEGVPPKRIPVPLAALRDLFAAASSSTNPARDRTILALLIGTGIRRGECASVRVEDITLYADGSGVMYVTGKHTRGNLDGRRGLAIDATTGKHIAAYLDMTRQSAGPLFRGRKGPLTTQSIYRVVKRCVETAGLEQYIQGCHDLRRAFATHYSRMFRGDGYADILRRQMGHTHYRMTSQYNLMDADDLRASIVSPLAIFDNGSAE